jgi:hypothetical protein
MITVMFSCKGCGLDKRKVEVTARESAEVDVVNWLEEVVQPRVAEEHKRLSPHCPNPNCDLLLPTPEGAEFLGQQVE